MTETTIDLLVLGTNAIPGNDTPTGNTNILKQLPKCKYITQGPHEAQGNKILSVTRDGTEIAGKRTEITTSDNSGFLTANPVAKWYWGVYLSQGYTNSSGTPVTADVAGILDVRITYRVRFWDKKEIFT